jgi:DNA-binding GntR family transcriptional regulator
MTELRRSAVNRNASQPPSLSPRPSPKRSKPPSSLNRLEPSPERTLSSELAALLKDAILAGKMTPNQHLIERKVSAAFGVSTIAVRDAFARLGEEGLIVRRPRRGAFVASVTADSARDLAGVRIVLDQHAVALALGAWEAPEDREGSLIVDKMRAAALDDDRELMVRLDHEFHTFIWRQSRSPSVVELAGQLRARLAWFIREATITESQSLPTIVESHDQWLEALRTRDLVRAGSEICTHYLRETESIVRLIASSDRLRSDPA